MRWLTVLVVAAACSGGCSGGTAAPSSPAHSPEPAPPEPMPSESKSSESTLAAPSASVTAAGGDGICNGPGTQRELEQLAECVRLAVGILDAEPADEAELADFVVRPLRGQHPERARYFQACGWLDGLSLVGIRFSKQTSAWDHFDDGSASAHIELRFACDEGPQATTQIELHMGVPAGQAD